MKHNLLILLKKDFRELCGLLSIEEIMSNTELVNGIKRIEELLSNIDATLPIDWKLLEECYAW